MSNESEESDPITPDLSLVDTNALFDEIAKRNKGVLMVLVSDVDARSESRLCAFKGGYILALGMAQYARQFLAEHEYDNRKDMIHDDNDDTGG